MVKAGSPVFIYADQALCSASVPRRVKIRGDKIATVRCRSYAPVMELVDMRDLGSRARACGFESLQAHQTGTIRTLSQQENGSDCFCFFRTIARFLMGSILTPSVLRLPHQIY